jgi:hypothetical protein
MFCIALPYWFGEGMIFASVFRAWLSRTSCILTLIGVLLYVASTVAAYLYFDPGSLIALHEKLMILLGPVLVAVWNLIRNRSAFRADRGGGSTRDGRNEMDVPPP